MDNEWEDICVLQWKTTKSHAWKEFCWKNVAQYFITPLMKVYQSNGNSQRNCGCQAAGHYHVFWECPNIQSYRKDIHKAIQDVFNTHTPFDFKIMYLGYIPPELAAGKKALTKRWMLQTGPTINNWVDVTIYIYRYIYYGKGYCFSQPKVRRIHKTLGKMGTIHQTFKTRFCQGNELKERPLFI